MTSLFIIKIPGWRTFVIQQPSFQGLLEFLRRPFHRKSPVVSAIVAGRSDLAVQLIRKGAIRKNDGALSHAAMRGDLAVVDALLKAGKDPDEPLHEEHGQGMTPLMWATNRRFHACMERLLEGGANVNAQAEDGTTAVMCCMSVGQPDDLIGLEILCRYRPDIAIKDWRGRDLIRVARDREINSGDPAMRRLLEAYYPDVDFTPP